MSATLDANVLLYAADSSSDVHEEAVAFLHKLAEGPDLLFLFWPVLMSFLRISTHPGVFHRPLTPSDARRNVESLLALPHVRTEAEAEGFWAVWTNATEGIVVRGNLVPDAHLVALMRQHGVRLAWSRDRDLRQFDGIDVRDPFADA